MATLLIKLRRAVSGSEKVQQSHFWFHNSGLILSPLRDQRQLNWLCDNTQATDLDHRLDHLVAILFLRILLWRLSQSDRGNSIQGGDDCQWEEMGGAKCEQRKTWIGVSPPSWDRGAGKTGPIR